jgi:hypothetical protein
MLCLSALGSVLAGMGHVVEVDQVEAAARAVYAKQQAKAA